MRNVIVCLLLVAGAGLWFYTGTHPRDLAPFLNHGAYYGMVTLFFFWIYAVAAYLQSKQFSWTSFIRRYYAGLLFCFFVTGLIYGSVKPSFKTLSDETNLLSTSHSMVFKKTASNEMMGIRYFGNFNSITEAIDKRPFLYPFLATLLHLARGYDASNAFLLNGLLMFCFLSGVFLCARRFFNGAISVAAVVLVCSIPIFSICGTSGGMDLLACFYLGLSLISLFLFLRDPSSPGFALLWMTLLALANARYESIFFFLCFMGFLLALGYVKGAYLKENRVLIAMTPLWLLIPVWGRLVYPNVVEIPGATHLFSFANFTQHLGALLKDQLNFRFVLPFNNLLNLFGFALAVYLLIAIFVQKTVFQKPEQRRFALVFIVSVLYSFTITLASFGGFYAHPAASRLFLPSALACAVLPFFYLATLPQEKLARLSTPVLLSAIALFVLYHPIAVEGRFINQSTLNRETEFAQGFVQKEFPDKHILIVAAVPSHFTSLEYGAIDFTTANANIPNFLSGLQRHMYQDIIVFQKVPYATGAPAPEERLDPLYALEPLSEYETDTDSFIRVSRVKTGMARADQPK